MSFPSLRSSGLRSYPPVVAEAVVVAAVASFVHVHRGHYRIFAIATADTTIQGFNQAHSGDWTLASRTGMRSSGTLPVGTVASSVSTTHLLSFAGEQPKGVVDATGTVAIGATAAMAHKGRYSISSRTGMYSRANLPTGTVVATAGLGSVGRMAAIGRVGTVSSRATIGNHARAELIGPAVRAVNGGRFAGRHPKGRLSAVATLWVVGVDPEHEFTPTEVVATYEGYSITMIPGTYGYETRTTHLTMCPFDHIVRMEDKYFGVGPYGVYELTGDTYDGTLIASSFETAPTAELSGLKRPRALFINGRLSDDFTVGVKVGETGECSVGSAIRAGTRNHRVLFPRGVQSIYLAYTFANTTGADFHINGITPEHDTVRRIVGGVE